MKGSIIGCAVAMMLGTAATALAHHSAAGIDRTKSQTVSGVVKEFRWTNPHSWIDLDVPNDKGGASTWSVEMTSPAFLIRAGWKSSSVKVGEKVTVTLRPFKSGEPGGLFVSITLPDGRTLGERPAAP
ncbi:MAG: DUF6152 family protein [Acidobacteriota bacterium]